MQEKIEELKKRRAKVMLGGGADKLEKQRKAGKLTARERIDALVDPGQLRGDRPVRRTPRHAVRHGGQGACRPTEW